MRSSALEPFLADLTQDIAGPIPVGLVREWLESAQDEGAHERLLAPFVRTGTIVCSDSAGLSKLSVGRPLVEVLKLVSEPKEAIFRHGTAIGGQAIGTWVADNTEMFYGDSIPPALVVTQMRAAQKAMRPLAVKVGIGIHHGAAYEIGGGLYGREADDIEGFTEEETRGGEVAVSEIVRAQIGEGIASVEERGGKYVLGEDDAGVEAPVADDPFYPAPFPRAFHESIRQLDAADTEAVEALHRAYAKPTVIILVRTFDAPDRLLDLFVSRMAAIALIRRIASSHGVQVLETGSAVTLLAVDDVSRAAAFAREIRSSLRDHGFAGNVALCHGEVLLFDRGAGAWNVAGAAVNVSSKLAEDTPERGAIFFESSVAHAAGPSASPFSILKSGVTITGVRT
jgi:hypothetical protein